MGRPYSIPDPNDRSKNDPSTIVSSDAVLSIYNRYNDEADEMQRVTDKVRDWFLEKSKGEGWTMLNLHQINAS